MRMSDDFQSKDLREMKEGRKILEGGGKKKGEKKKVWPKGRGSATCDVCYGHCCGSNPYRTKVASRACQTDEMIHKVM